MTGQAFPTARILDAAASFSLAPTVRQRRPLPLRLGCPAGLTLRGRILQLIVHRDFGVRVQGGDRCPAFTVGGGYLRLFSSSVALGLDLRLGFERFEEVRSGNLTVGIYEPARTTRLNLEINWSASTSEV